MKAAVEQEAFARAVGRAELGGLRSAPIHGLVRLEAREAPQELVISAVAATASIVTRIPAEVRSPGVAVVLTHALSAAARAMPVGGLLLSSSDKRLFVKSTEGRTWSGAVSDPEWAAEPGWPGELRIVQLPQRALLTALARTTHVAALVDREDEVVVRAVRLEAREKRLTAIACARTLLAVSEHDLDEALEPWSATVGESGLGPLAELLDEVEKAKAPLELASDEHSVYMRGPATRADSRVPVVPFPDWKDLLEGFADEPACTLKREPLLESLRAAQAVQTTRDPGAEFQLRGGILTINRADPDTDFTDQVPVEGASGAEVSFRASMPYLLHCLKAAPEDPRLSFATDGKCMKLDAGGYRAIIAIMK